MRVYAVARFDRSAARYRLQDEVLLSAVDRAESGLVDADLGGGLIKLRIARPGQGRSGGFRTILAYRRGEVAVFLRVFAKNEQSDLSPPEVATLKVLGGRILEQSENERNAALADGTLREIG